MFTRAIPFADINVPNNAITNAMINSVDYSKITNTPTTASSDLDDLTNTTNKDGFLRANSNGTISY